MVATRHGYGSRDRLVDKLTTIVAPHVTRAHVRVAGQRTEAERLKRLQGVPAHGQDRYISATTRERDRCSDDAGPLQ